LIRPLRRTHQVVFLLMAIVLPWLIAAALLARRTVGP
jgi:hypothetical protein